MNKVIFLVAMEEEAEYIKKSFNINLKIEKNFYKSEKFDNLFILVTGVGVGNVLKTITNCFNEKLFDKNDKFINIGYVGSPSYNVGDIIDISCAKRLFEPQKVKNLNKTFTLKSVFADENICKNSTLYTADDFVENRELTEKDCVVDMEGYYIACMIENVHMIKIVSDNLCLKDCNEAHRKECINNAWENLLNNIKKVI